LRKGTSRVNSQEKQVPETGVNKGGYTMDRQSEKAGDEQGLARRTRMAKPEPLSQEPKPKP